MTKIQEKNSDLISIAPMLDWTDTHFRQFLRLICRRPTFYTEMIACPALILGDRKKLLAYNPAEHPLVLQVGGSDPHLMAECAQIAYDTGYKGININAGCPSDRVQSGRFGAILMKTPEIIADCVAEMTAKTPLPVSVKTRIALADTAGDGFAELFHLADLITRAGCRHIIVHARKAKLNLSPKDNRQKLPLNYEVVYRLKRSFPDIFITINGNILSLDEVAHHLRHTDGVMIGRWAYGNPYALAQVDQMFYNDNHPILTRHQVLESFLPYLETHSDKLSIILPHLMGLFHGEPNARRYKATLATRNISTIKDFLKGSK
ncbi:MAG: tRNA dihydrouridine(20/20a) synthase DusA [Alphaproteobacteria bacterium]|nr:tRNA dihydrouridine(20/20a) synthase DusA [Alphaproteobacteria bacterium]